MYTSSYKRLRGRIFYWLFEVVRTLNLPLPPIQNPCTLVADSPGTGILKAGPIVKDTSTAEETGTTYPYFNHRAYQAEGRWSRRTFVGKWRRLGGHDPLWRPPPPSVLRRTLSELKPVCLWLEALPKDPTFRGSSFEVPVATAAVQQDAQNPDTGYLTLLQFANDRDTLYALLEHLSETLRPHGIRTLTGPTHLLPHLGGGALSSHWQLPPPTDTPYNPPYVSEHLDALTSPVDTLSLFHFETRVEKSPTEGAVVLQALEPRHLPNTLPLLQTACSATTLSPPDAAEVQAILRWLEPRQPFGFFATLPGAPETPVGFALLYPDSVPRAGLRRARARTGRLLGGVLPDARRQGVGRTLLSAALKEARTRGWDSVSVGPVSQKGDAAAFLEACGGVRQQGYTLYKTKL